MFLSVTRYSRTSEVWSGLLPAAGRRLPTARQRRGQGGRKERSCLPAVQVHSFPKAEERVQSSGTHSVTPNCGHRRVPPAQPCSDGHRHSRHPHPGIPIPAGTSTSQLCITNVTPICHSLVYLLSHPRQPLGRLCVQQNGLFGKGFGFQYLVFKCKYFSLFTLEKIGQRNAPGAQSKHLRRSITTSGVYSPPRTKPLESCCLS